ncbi:MAG: polyisoprenoid-binding protein [Xanthomonadales bacterium]|nr:polyisoprenoid-binding protein [Xanthomonadales bacterium]
MTRCFAVLLLLFALPAAVAAQTREYRIDPDHSRVLFRIDHLGLSSSLGTFANLDGEFRFDENYWKTARVTVSIPLNSLNLGDADWRRKVLADYLNANMHPTARFESTGLVPDDDSLKTGRLNGKLTLNGVTRPVELQLRFNGSNKGIYTKLRRKTGFSATTSIRRSDFELDKQLDLVGDEVRIEIEVEGIEQRQ